MIENVLSSINGIGTYGVISICIFVVTFVVAVLWMLTVKKSYIRSMSQLPLEDENDGQKRDSESNGIIL
jgi:cytochrome c oxidase cbb3-type subunit 4